MTQRRPGPAHSGAPLPSPPLPGTTLAGPPSAASEATEATGLRHVLHRRQMTMIALGTSPRRGSPPPSRLAASATALAGSAASAAATATKLRVRMWGYPYLTYFTICGMLAIAVAMDFIPDQRAPLSFGLLSVVILLLAFAVRRRFGGGSRPQTADLSP